MKQLLLLGIILSISIIGNVSYNQFISLPTRLNHSHPRLNADSADWQRISIDVQKNETAIRSFQTLKQNVDDYVSRHQKDSTWMPSRLQMYWKTKSTDVYINAGFYDHADGNAPVPTVRFPGARDATSAYGVPRLEDIIPYDDNPAGVMLINRSKPGQPLERAEISRTGRNIETINNNIMSLAASSSQLYWISGEEKYARFAYNLFDTYMTGMYYRNAPHDLTNGHHGTIVGLSTFEVIQEGGIISNLASTYDFLFHYIQKRSPEKMKLYSDVLKRWAEIQIDHGVAYNNWNLMELRNILTIAEILEDNDHYTDGKGRLYYIDYALNKNSERQWSIAKVVKEGYDPLTGIWYECPGYSSGVLGSITGLITLFQNRYHHDILPSIPIMNKAVLAVAEYLFPNGYNTSFGDSHYSRLSTGPVRDMIANAQLFNKPKQDTVFTRFLKTFPSANSDRRGSQGGRNISLRNDYQAVIKEGIPGGKIEDYVSPAFYSSNVSYFALRNGMDPNNGLMVAMSGSKGNHMHAGGISMEIFGKGIVLGPESGIGTSYFQQDYAEYYSQFPAHNTVAVDGISAYPVMKSNHGFDLTASYPASGIKKGFFPLVSYGDLAFLEPETQSDQRRLTAIIRTGDSSAYYVDIFRSKRKDGKDKMHDYFYHNLGQSLVVKANDGISFYLQPTEKLSFSGGHLFAYDYFWDKKSITTSKDINALFNLAVPGREDVQMNMWMKGEPDREIFAVKSPRSRAFGNNAMIPDSIANLPMPTIVARQTGEAWTRPFTVVFEPSTTSQPKTVTKITSFKPEGASNDFVGLKVDSKGNISNYVFTSIEKELLTYKNNEVLATFAVTSYKDTKLQYLFMDNGTQISSDEYSIKAATPVAAVLFIGNGEVSFTAANPVTLQLPGTCSTSKKPIITYSINNKKVTIRGKRITDKGKPVIIFEMPAMDWSPLSIV